MPLPKLDVPFSTFKLPSTNEEILIRPFSVKEEKIILMAMESEDEVDMITAIKQVVNNCIVTETVDFDKLSYFDFEYLFLQLRIISVGNSIELGFVHTKEDCMHTNKVMVDLTKLVFAYEPKTDKDMLFMIDEKIGMKLKYPSISMLLKYKELDLTSVFNMLLECIEYIFDDNEVYKDFTHDEIKEFVEGIPQKNIKGLIDFIASFPMLEKKLDFKCEKCGDDLSTTLKGIKHFFG